MIMMPRSNSCCINMSFNYGDAETGAWPEAGFGERFSMLPHCPSQAIRLFTRVDVTAHFQ